MGSIHRAEVKVKADQKKAEKVALMAEKESQQRKLADKVNNGLARIAELVDAQVEEDAKMADNDIAPSNVGEVDDSVDNEANKAFDDEYVGEINTGDHSERDGGEGETEVESDGDDDSGDNGENEIVEVRMVSG